LTYNHSSAEKIKWVRMTPAADGRSVQLRQLAPHPPPSLLRQFIDEIKHEAIFEALVSTNERLSITARAE